MQEGANGLHIRVLPRVFKDNRNDHPRKRATGDGGGEDHTGKWRTGPAVAEQVFEVRVTAGPQ